MDKIEAMKRFMMVAQTGSFTQAAELLDIPKSAVSASVNNLETHLQTRLFHRSTRKVTLTEVGERYLPQCQTLLEELDELDNQFQGESNALTGTIRINMPSRFLTANVLPYLNTWFERHPMTQIRLVSADYRINPIKEGVDCTVRVGQLEDSELIARQLGTINMVNCISPSYANRYGVPSNLESLRDHYVVDYAPTLLQSSGGFEYLDGGIVRKVSMANLVSVSTTDAYLSACLNGLGIVQIPRMGVQDLIDSGLLMEVMDQYCSANMPVALLYASRRQLPRRLTEFMDWLADLFQKLNHRQSEQ
jgi:DNA-binding transcriptional LysR family regulator